MTASASQQELHPCGQGRPECRWGTRSPAQVRECFRIPSAFKHLIHASAFL